MTNDPYRQPTPQDPYENPYRVNEEENRSGTGVAMILGALLLAAIAGFVYFSTGDQATVANNDIRPPITQSNDPARDPARPAVRETTGSGTSNLDQPAPSAEPRPADIDQRPAPVPQTQQ